MILQAFYIQLYLGYFSGIARNIEKAEASSMLGTTMIRRGQLLRAEQYQPVNTSPDWTLLSLEQQWCRWVKQETQKRLVYFAVTLDSHVSMSRRINVLFPYAEVETPLPSASALWESSEPMHWNQMTQRTFESESLPSLRSVLRQPQLLFNSSNSADMRTAAFIAFSGFWPLVHEFRQMESLLTEAQNWNDFVINSRHSELTTTLGILEGEIGEVARPCSKGNIIRELVSLHLYASFYDLSNYSGRGSTQEALTALPYTQRWYESPHSRQALWHAGQILKAARELEAEALADIYVIALYHAGFILWIWGVMWRCQEPAKEQITPQVAIDAELSTIDSKIMRSRRWMPVLTGQDGNMVSLDNPCKVADMVGDVVQANWSSRSPLPLTSEEVLRLMRGFSEVARGSTRRESRPR
jgi:hypothetical protein